MSYLFSVVASGRSSVLVTNGLLLETIVLLEEVPEALIAADLHSL
jgi:hypothetical protein